MHLEVGRPAILRAKDAVHAVTMNRTHYAGKRSSLRQVEATRMSHSVFVMSKLSHENRPGDDAGTGSSLPCNSLPSLLATALSSGIESGLVCLGAIICLLDLFLAQNP